MDVVRALKIPEDDLTERGGYDVIVLGTVRGGN
jgi:hypothetical protein